jgi:hypothetical protein
MSNPLDRVTVFFRAELNASTNSYSPSSGKPRAVVEDWIDRDLPIRTESSEPLLAIHRRTLLACASACLATRGLQ